VIERRRIELVLRNGEHDGAPPRVRVDLDEGVAVITRAPIARGAANPDDVARAAQAQCPHGRCSW
jgi:hypothetical protein